MCLCGFLCIMRFHFRSFCVLLLHSSSSYNEFDSGPRIIISMTERFRCHFRPLNPFGRFLRENQDFLPEKRKETDFFFRVFLFVFAHGTIAQWSHSHGSYFHFYCFRIIIFLEMENNFVKGKLSRRRHGQCVFLTIGV